MATRRKERPLRGNGRDGLDYAEFMEGLCDGSIRATRLNDTTVPDGTREVVRKRFDDEQNPLPDEVATVSRRRLTKLEYDDPNG